MACALCGLGEGIETCDSCDRDFCDSCIDRGFGISGCGSHHRCVSDEAEGCDWNCLLCHVLLRKWSYIGRLEDPEGAYLRRICRK